MFCMIEYAHFAGRYSNYYDKYWDNLWNFIVYFATWAFILRLENPKRGESVEFSERMFVRKVKGKASERGGSLTSFDTCESRILIHSVPLPRVGIFGALGFVMSYIIDNLLFR